MSNADRALHGTSASSVHGPGRLPHGRPCSADHGKGEVPKRLESRLTCAIDILVPFVGGRRSIFVALDLDANGSASQAGRRSVSDEPPRAPGSTRRARPDPPDEESVESSGVAGQQPRGTVRRFRRPGPLDCSMTAGSAGEHERKPYRERKAPRLTFAVRTSPPKVQVSAPDNIVGTHR